MIFNIPLRGMSHQHFVLYKPFGVLSQFVNNKTRKKKLLGDLFDFPEGTMAIGRLDVKSEGLLLLTTDGKKSEHIRGRKVEKEYYVQLDGEISEGVIDKLKSGVEISIEGKAYKTLPCKVNALDKAPEFSERSRKVRDDRHGPTSWISITLTEGKFHQVRKMTAVVGFPTLRLVRVRVGEFTLANLKEGEVIELESL